MKKDFYLVLQVARRASPEEIRSAYRRRAMELHPDKSRSESDPFIELQEAYSVLSDPSKRVVYDRVAQSVPTFPGTRLGPSPFAESFREVEPVERLREISLTQSFDTYAPSFDEIFDRLWSNFKLVTRPKAERVESLTVEVPLSAQEAFAGGRVRILVPARVTCERCLGHGTVGFYECWRCRGQGSILAEYPCEIAYPAGLRRDYVARVPLANFGIRNFYLTVRFRPTETETSHGFWP